jgi:hypothetical protein
MFAVTEPDAATIRAAFDRGGELAADAAHSRPWECLPTDV